MKKILFVCPYPENKAPSQRLKYEQYFPHFREAGYDLTVKPFMSEKFWSIAYKPGNKVQKLSLLLKAYLNRFLLLFSIRRYDVVYIHLWVTPFGPPVFESLVRLLARKVIFDIDDLVYMKNSKGDKWYTRLFKGRNKPVFLIKKADYVIACTPYLYDFVYKHNPNVVDISSTINTDTYLPVNGFENNKQITLGWSGSHSTIRYLSLLQPVLRKLSEEIPFTLLVMGGKGFTMEGVQVDSREWSEETEIATLQQMDIGLYPLPLDEQWVYGKSGLKALQYMAIGLPVVATAIGANFRIIENGETGMLVTTQEEWLSALKKLIQDPVLRKTIGSKARENVLQHYSVRANAPVYLEVISKVVKA